MNTNPVDLFTVFDYGLGGLDWQSWVDKYNEKYDILDVDGFVFQPTRLNYTYAQLIAQTGAKSLPTWVDPDAQGYEASLSGASGTTGNIPTMKRYYRINRTILNEKYQLIQRYGNAVLDSNMQDVFMGLVDESTDGLIGSYRNALTHERNQIVSNGKFSLNSINNPRGLQGIQLDFGIDQTHFDTLTTSARWWTNADHSTEGTTSDPLEYLKQRVKAIRKTFHYLGQLKMELSQDLWDDMLTHSKVRERLAIYFYPTTTDSATRLSAIQDKDDAAFKDAIQRIIKVDSIVIKESYAWVDAPGTNSDGDPDLVPTRIDNFNPLNVAFVPLGIQLGDIQGVSPLAVGIDVDKVAYFDTDRFLVTQYTNPKTKSIYVEGEAAQLCVPSVPQWMFISTVTV